MVEGCYGSESIELSSSDYTFSEGVLKLHVSTTDKALLRTPTMDMIRVTVSADGYPDSEAYIYGIEDGQYAVKIVLHPNSANSDLNESNLNGAKVDIYLQNTLKFSDDQLDINNFSIAEVTDDSGYDIGVEGVTIQSIEYLTPTTATVTLAFNGYDFDEFKQLSIAISPDELNTCEELKSQNLPIPPVIEQPRKVMLYASDATDSTRFGSAVDIDEELVVVSSNSNKVYIFQKDNNNSYFEVNSTTLPDDTYPHIQSISLEGDYLVVSKNDDDLTGKVYLYKSDFGHQYNLKYDLTPQSGLSNYGNFGAKVVMKNNLIAIAYGGTTSENSKIYLYELDSNGDIAAQSSITLPGVNLSTVIEEFGLDMEYNLADDSYIIAAGSKDGSNQNGVVSVYKYQNHSSTYLGSIYHPQVDASVTDRFGQSVAIDKNYVAISSLGTNEVHIYQVYTPTNITLIKSIQNPTQGFGINLDIDSDFRLKVVVGTLADKAYSYIFDKYNQTYQTHESHLTDGDDFGERVALYKENVIYSLVSNSDKGDHAGAALVSYVWDDVSTGIDTTPYQFTFDDVTGANLDQYYQDDIVVIGINAPAPLSITGGEYSLDGGSTWSTQPTNVIQNQEVIVRVRSSANYGVTTSATLTIGDVSDTFSVTTQTNSNTPTITPVNTQPTLDEEYLSFNYSTDQSWESNITQILYKAGDDAEYVVLSDSDYTFEDGVFKLNISSSSNPCLHLPYSSGGELTFVSTGYDDLVVSLPPLGEGSYEAKANISSTYQLTENTLDDTNISLELVNTLVFDDSVLLKDNFVLSKAPDGVSIQTVEYVDQTHANIILAFDGTNFDEDKELQVAISKDELNLCRGITTNTLPITPELEMYYDDINISINLHQSDSVFLGINNDQNLTIFTPPSEGNASVYLVGNEYWTVYYKNTECGTNDKIIYETYDGKGTINIDIIKTTDIANDFNITVKSDSTLYKYELFDDTNITAVTITQAQNGEATIVHEDGKYMLTYTPNDGFIGVENLTLSITGTQDGCPFNQNSDVTINVTIDNEYAMFAFVNENGECVPFVSDGLAENTKALSLVFNDGRCNSGEVSKEFVKQYNNYLFTQNTNNLYYGDAKNETLTLLNSSDEFQTPLLDHAKFYKTTMFHPNDMFQPFTNESRIVFSATKSAPADEESENQEEENIGAGMLPWAVDTQANLSLVDDIVIGVGGDEVLSRYVQDYKILYYLTEFPTMTHPIFRGDHIYYIGQDNINGNGLVLMESCIFDGFESCSDAEPVWLYDVNQTEGLKSSSSFGIGRLGINDIIYFDNTNFNLWITTGMKLDYLRRSDATTLITDSGYEHMEFKESSNRDILYYQATKENGDRVIGYFYYKTPVDTLPLIYTCNIDDCSRLIELDSIEKHLALIDKREIINLTDSTGLWTVAKNKVYVTENETSYSNLYQIVNGSKVLVQGITNISIEELKYIDGYLYVFGLDDEDKNALYVVDTKDNSVELIEYGKTIVLYPYSIYKNNYSHYKVFYMTKELDDSEDNYIYKLYGYNAYKNESVLLKTQTLSAE